MPTSSYGRTLIKRVRNNDVEFGLLARNGAILVGCSGGPDSVALLHILLSLRSKLNLRLGVAHVNYGIRGIEADADEALVRKLSALYSIPFFPYHPRGAKTMNEEELRTVRYRFFEDRRRRQAFDDIAVAHTQDDQAETVLIRILRGSGPEGLAAMRPRNGRLIRPLLDITKDELLRFLSEENIPYRLDASNLDTDILRNRIRHELLPLLDREYRPGIRKVLSRMARVFGRSVPDGSSRPFPPYDAIPGGLRFRISDFLNLSKTDRAETLRNMYLLVAKTGSNPPESFVREVEKLILSSKNKIRTYRSRRLKIEARGDKVAFVRTYKESSL